MNRSVKVVLFIVGQGLLLFFVWVPLFFMGIAMATCGGDEGMFKAVGVGFSAYVVVSFVVLFKGVIKRSAKEIAASGLDQVVEYITSARAEGMSDDLIRTNLYAVGWGPDEVSEAFARLS